MHHYGAGGCLERHRFLFKTLVTGGYVDLSRKQRQDVVGYCEALEEVLEKLSKALTIN